MRWVNYAEEVPHIETEKCFIDIKNIKVIQLVGFIQASKIGYATCIYIQTEYTDDSRSLRRLVSMTIITRLVNIKPTVESFECKHPPIIPANHKVGELSESVTRKCMTVV